MTPLIIKVALTLICFGVFTTFTGILIEKIRVAMFGVAVALAGCFAVVMYLLALLWAS